MRSHSHLTFQHLNKYFDKMIIKALLISFVVGTGTGWFGDVKPIPRSRTCEESDSSSGQINDKITEKLVGDGDSCIYKINNIDSNFIRIKLHGLSFGSSCKKDFGFKMFFLSRFNVAPIRF